MAWRRGTAPGQKESTLLATPPLRDDSCEGGGRDARGGALQTWSNSWPRARSRVGAYQKAQDPAVLPLVCRLVDARPTYGCRRITALLNRDCAAKSQRLPNHKRAYRLMKVGPRPAAGEVQRPTSRPQP